MVTSQYSNNQVSDFQASIILNPETQQLEPLNDSFVDGCWDGTIGAEPEDYQILSGDYRNGYLEGTRTRLEKRLTQINEAI